MGRGGDPPSLRNGAEAERLPGRHGGEYIEPQVGSAPDWRKEPPPTDRPVTRTRACFERPRPDPLFRRPSRAHAGSFPPSIAITVERVRFETDLPDS